MGLNVGAGARTTVRMRQRQETRIRRTMIGAAAAVVTPAVLIGGWQLAVNLWLDGTPRPAQTLQLGAAAVAPDTNCPESMPSAVPVADDKNKAVTLCRSTASTSYPSHFLAKGSPSVAGSPRIVRALGALDVSPQMFARVRAGAPASGATHSYGKNSGIQVRQGSAKIGRNRDGLPLAD